MKILDFRLRPPMKSFLKCGFFNEEGNPFSWNSPWPESSLKRSMPMLLDRPVDAITAGLTSLRLVLTQTGVMLFWGLLISLLVLLAMLPGFAGLLIVGPVLGHASWHAYRAAVVD